MAIDTSSLSGYTWTQIKLAAGQAIMGALLGGTSLTINGRLIARCSTQDAQAIYTWASEMEAIDGAGPAGFGNILVKFGEPQ